MTKSDVPVALAPPARHGLYPASAFFGRTAIDDALRGTGWSPETLYSYLSYLQQFCLDHQSDHPRVTFADPALAIANSTHQDLRRNMSELSIPRSGMLFVPFRFEAHDPWSALLCFRSGDRPHVTLMAATDAMDAILRSPRLDTLMHWIAAPVSLHFPLGSQLAPSDSIALVAITAAQIACRSPIGSTPWMRSAFLAHLGYMACGRLLSPARLVDRTGATVMAHVFEPAEPAAHLVALAMNALRPGLCSCWFPFSDARAVQFATASAPFSLLDSHSIGPGPLTVQISFLSPPIGEVSTCGTNDVVRFRPIRRRCACDWPFLDRRGPPLAFTDRR